MISDRLVLGTQAMVQTFFNCFYFDWQYWCKGSMLFGTVRDAGWENWKGVMRHYWGGSDGYDGFCACGLVGTLFLNLFKLRKHDDRPT